MTLKILGIDPGLRFTGWGIVQQDGSRLVGIAAGAIRANEKLPTAERLAYIANELQKVIGQYRPDEAAVEEIFTNSNAASTQKLGLARGVALVIPAMAGLSVGEYAANLIKKCVSGYGHADKKQMMAMIKILLPQLDLPRADAADAIAVAITHAHLRKNLLQKAKVTSKPAPKKR